MIKVSDLRRIKKLCFDKIAQGRIAKNSLAVKFAPINTELYEIILSNGEDFARYIGNVTKPCILSEMQISWNDFAKICDLFQKEIQIIVKNNKIFFIEGKTKYNCTHYMSKANDNVYFKFDFENAIKISMDDLYILKDLGMINKFAIGKEYLISIDSNFCVINKLTNNIGDKVFLFTTKFPSGTWYFNPDYRIIVSEDKKIACTIKKANGDFPFEPLINLSNQILNNYFEVNAKEFGIAIDNCSQIDQKIDLILKDNSIVLKSINGLELLETEIDAKFEHISPKGEIRFLYKYLKEFLRCSNNNKLKIYFDDNVNEYKLKSLKDNLVMFGTGLRVI